MLSIEGLPVRPAKVRAFIKASFPDGIPRKLDLINSGKVLGVLMLIERLNPAILAESLAPDEEIGWYIAVSAIHQKLRQWEGGDQAPFGVEANGEQAISTINRLLEKCPEMPTPKASACLMFIQDSALRESIGRDIDTLETLMPLGEWKAVTVLGGSVIEAILLDALLKKESLALAAYPKKFSKPPSRALRNWDLGDMIEIAKHPDLNLISEREYEACNVVRKYRNLIHPGRELRLSEPCSPGTAKIACGAVDLLVEKFSQHP